MQASPTEAALNKLREVAVELRWPEGREPGQACAVQAKARSGTLELHKISGVSPVNLALDPALAWQIGIDCPGFWAERIAWQGEPAVELELVPTGSVVARLPAGLAKEGLDKPRIRFRDTAHSQLGDARKFQWQATGACNLMEVTLECELPRGHLDLRLEIGNFAPMYFWGIHLAEGKTLSLGELLLTPGRSISGWLESPETVAGVTVEAVPEQVASSPDPAKAKRLKLRFHRTESAAGGFFRIAGLPPGSYVLKAQTERSSSPPVTVRLGTDQTHLELAQPLRLQPYRRLEIELVPEVDPWSKPWTITLSRSEERGRRSRKIVQRPVSVAGQWEVEGLETGATYEIKVRDSKGSRWLDEQVTLDSGDERLLFEIDVIPVRGKLSWRGEPVVARLMFGGTYRAVSVAMETAEDGSFEGNLPNEGIWPLDLGTGEEIGSQAVVAVEIRRRPGKSFVWLELELPDTLLRGRVVRDGEAVAEAMILGMRETRQTKRREFELRTDAEGRFEVKGLTPGRFGVQALAVGASSEWFQVDLREGLEHPEVLLELLEKVKVLGRLVGSTGPVAGARILFRPSHDIERETISGVAGDFQLRLTGRNTYIDMMIIPPTGAVVLQRLKLPVDGDAVTEQVVAIPPEGGDLTVFPPFKTPTRLTFGSVGFALNRFIVAMIQAGRMESGSAPGILLRGMAPGKWTLCTAAGIEAESCVNTQVLPRGVAVLELQQQVAKEESPS